MIKDNLQAKEVVIGEGEHRRRYILSYNPKEVQRQKRHLRRNATAQWAIELLASPRYKRYVTITKGNKIRIDRGSIREAEKYDGK